MSEGLPWVRVLIMLGLLGAMFAFPVAVITVQQRRRRNTDPSGD